MSRNFAIGLAGFAVAAVCVAAPFVSQQDLSSIPPEPATVHKTLTGCKTSLAQAIDIAQKESGGLAKSAEMRLDGAAQIAEVLLYSADKATRIVVDAATGEIKSRTDVPPFTMPGDPVKGDMVTTASGLMYYDLKVGDGKQPSGPNSTVKVHYTGWLVDGEEFDSSVKHGQPATFRLNQVIRGWTEGVGSMKVGGKRKLIIPNELAWPQGRPPLIPPKAMVIFDVELLDVLEPTVPPQP
jgi:FKBP-type peptidyl-prolyl cis-trans isomerase